MILKPGHVMSNEPNFIKRANLGIRIENMIYVKQIKKKIFFKKFNYGAD